MRMPIAILLKVHITLEKSVLFFYECIIQVTIGHLPSEFFTKFITSASVLVRSQYNTL
jgi:hypothetical protein